MISLNGDCFNTLYLKALKVAISGTQRCQSSRVGPVINLGQAFFEIMPDDPRIIFLNHRKINPVFAIIEGAWVLSGSNELNPLLKELPNFSVYSDNGETLNGAYGNRLRNFFGIDQINVAIEALKTDFHTRRIALTIFSPSDLTINSLDIPCNTSAYLKVSDGALDITVLNRSNDLYLGLPYNVFVFGLLQKHVSLKLGLRVGIQRHFSDNLHLYEKNVNEAKRIVQGNSFEAVSVVSSNFDWGYADAILENIQEILKSDYEAISDTDLAVFLKHFNRESRLHNRLSETFVFSNDFYGFLAYQCYSPIGYKTDDNEHWGKLRRLMMTDGIRQKFERLSVSSGQNIAQNIVELTEQLRGRFCVLKEVIDKENGPFGFKGYDNEESALRVLLLCLVWTVRDVYTANTSIGDMQEQEIATAASILNVPFSDIGPLCVFENELLSALSKMLPR